MEGFHKGYEFTLFVLSQLSNYKNVRLYVLFIWLVLCIRPSIAVTWNMKSIETFMKYRKPCHLWWK